MTTHLATPDRVLCHTRGRWLARSGVLADVTCVRCTYRLAVVDREESEAAFDRTRFAEAAAAAESFGAERLWSLVMEGETATDVMVRNILAAILTGLAGQTPRSAKRAS